MILIGEKLNSSIPGTLKALKEGDEAYLIAQIEAQAEAGADYLDLNTALCGEAELSQMLRLIDLTLQHCQAGIMIDSPSPAVALRAAEKAQGRPLILNSVTVSQRIEELTPVAARLGAGVVGLPIDGGIPESAQGRADNAARLIEKLTAGGVRPENIYIDALVETLATGDINARTTLQTIALIKERFPQVKTLCGLSNISFGLPKRAEINAAFLGMAVWQGLDSAILSVTATKLITALRAAEALCGRDEYCMEYIAHIRSLS